MNPGPCVYCGGTDYPPSMGGPMICPSCDCGDFGPTRVRRLGEDLARYRMIAAALMIQFDVPSIQIAPSGVDRATRAKTNLVLRDGMIEFTVSANEDN